MERENILTAVELGIITHAQAKELLRRLYVQETTGYETGNSTIKIRPSDEIRRN